MTDYEPGTCNINKKESQKRQYAGIIGLIASGILGTVFILVSLPPYTLFFVFLLAVFGFQGLIQSKNNFCVAHAQKGTQKTTNKTEEVQGKENKEKDKSKAKEIMSKSVALGIVITVAFYILETIAGF